MLCMYDRAWSLQQPHEPLLSGPLVETDLEFKAAQLVDGESGI